MGSEQSHTADGHNSTSRLQRGNTIAVSGRRLSSPNQEPGTINSTIPDSRPVSPPISVCSDSDLPYVSYTDKPIGGKFFFHLHTNSFGISILYSKYMYTFIQTHRNYVTE